MKSQINVYNYTLSFITINLNVKFCIFLKKISDTETDHTHFKKTEVCIASKYMTQKTNTEYTS